MRIGLIAPPWVPVPPPRYGGIEAVIDSLARGLVRAGHQVLLAAAGNSSCPVPRVPCTEDVAPGAAVLAETNTEFRHALQVYPAMRALNFIHPPPTAAPPPRLGAPRTSAV